MILHVLSNLNASTVLSWCKHAAHGHINSIPFPQLPGKAPASPLPSACRPPLAKSELFSCCSCRTLHVSSSLTMATPPVTAAAAGIPGLQGDQVCGQAQGGAPGIHHCYCTPGTGGRTAHCPQNTAYRWSLV